MSQELELERTRKATKQKVADEASAAVASAKSLSSSSFSSTAVNDKPTIDIHSISAASSRATAALESTLDGRRTPVGPGYTKSARGNGGRSPRSPAMKIDTFSR